MDWGLGSAARGFRVYGVVFKPHGLPGGKASWKLQLRFTYSLHCSSFFGFNQIYNKDLIR